MYSESEIRALGSQLHEIVEEMLGRDLRKENLSTFDKICPIEIDPENMHESKRQYLSELEFIKGWIEQFDQLSEVLHRDATLSEGEDMDDLVQFLNGFARSESKAVEPETALDLAVSNAMRSGIVPCLLMINEKLRPLLETRLGKLQSQENDFWSVSHRAPNYYARTIALRLARLFALETGKFPTMGTASYSNQPSTKYARALEGAFRVLSIEADFRKPGEWAIARLTGKDLVRRRVVDTLEVLKEIKKSDILKEGP